MSKHIIQMGSQERAGIGSVIKNLMESKGSRDVEFIPSYQEGDLLKVIFYIFPIAVVKAFLRVIKYQRNIIHLHMAPRGSYIRAVILQLVLKTLLRQYFVIHLHGAEFKSYIGKYEKNKLFRLILKRFLSRIDHFIVLSPSWKEYVSFLAKKYQSTKLPISVVQNPISLERTGHKRQNKLQNGVLRILFMGRLAEVKNPFALIELAKRLRNRKMHFEIGIAGDGKLYSELEAAIKEKNLPDHVKLLGWISAEERLKAFRSYNVFVLPSWDENLPMVIIESMANCMPIVASAVGGVPEMVENGVNGYVFPAGDGDAFEEAVVKLYENPQLITEMGDNNYKKSSFYDVNTVWRKIDAIYESLEK